MTDRDLVRLYWPADLRPSFDALFALDDAMAEIVLRATQPALAAITLAWWREALERLDTTAPPAEPRLEAASRELLPRGLSGAQLSELALAWEGLLADGAAQPEAEERGRLLFRLASMLLGVPRGDRAGSAFGRADMLRKTGESRWKGRAPEFPSARKPIRALTALDALARRDLRRDTLEPEATPARAWTLLRHRWTGRF